MQNKENAYHDYIEFIKNSWTWEKLTEAEKKLFLQAALNAKNQVLFGTYRQRWNILNALYSAFLHGTGYDDNTGFYKWRATEEERETMPKF